MSESPDEIRRDIERTRSELGQTLEDIEERISPSKVRERQFEAAKAKLDEAGVTEKAQQAFDFTRGNPIGAAAAAFAGGFLVGLILPKGD